VRLVIHVPDNFLTQNNLKAQQMPQGNPLSVANSGGIRMKHSCIPRPPQNQSLQTMHELDVLPSHFPEIALLLCSKTEF
jgi:hypothetical protein